MAIATGRTRRKRHGGCIAAGLVAAVLLVGCADPVPDVSAGEDLAHRFTEALGVEPDTRRILEHNNNMVNRLSDTVQARWTGLNLGPRPLDRLASALEEVGLTVTYRSSEIPDGRPRSGGVDPDELEACLDDDARDIGAQVSVGRTEAGFEVVAEFGGPPASSGCATLVD
jgi:hypothetical protein